MAIRQLRIMGDPILNKKSREVTELTPRIRDLIEDLVDTMYENNGVGLAAVQVGVLRRICVIDVGEGPVVFVNPEIVEQEGEQTGDEGCLSVPGKSGIVTRPIRVKAKALDKNLQPFEIEGQGLFARAMCHEFEHLDGHLYVEHAQGPLKDVTYNEPEEEEEEESCE